MVVLKLFMSIAKSYVTTAINMNSTKNKGGEQVKVPDTSSHTPTGAEGWKDVLQLLKEQSGKMERLSMALKGIQDWMRQNTPTTVKTSVGEATEVLGSLLNAYECLMKSGLEIQKRLESHPATKKMRIFQRPRSASLGDTPKSQAKGEKRAALSPHQEKTSKRRKGGPSPLYAQVTKSQAPNKEGD